MPKQKGGAMTNEGKIAELELRVKRLEDTLTDLVQVLQTAGGKLRNLPPDASPLDAHKIIIEAGGNLLSVRRINKRGD